MGGLQKLKGGATGHASISMRALDLDKVDERWKNKKKYRGNSTPSQPSIGKFMVLVRFQHHHTETPPRKPVANHPIGDSARESLQKVRVPAAVLL